MAFVRVHPVFLPCSLPTVARCGPSQEAAGSLPNCPGLLSAFGAIRRLLGKALAAPTPVVSVVGSAYGDQIPCLGFIPELVADRDMAWRRAKQQATRAGVRGMVVVMILIIIPPNHRISLLLFRNGRNGGAQPVAANSSPSSQLDTALAGTSQTWLAS